MKFFRNDEKCECDSKKPTNGGPSLIKKKICMQIAHQFQVYLMSFLEEIGRRNKQFSVRKCDFNNKIVLACVFLSLSVDYVVLNLFGLTFYKTGGGARLSRSTVCVRGSNAIIFKTTNKSTKKIYNNNHNNAFSRVVFV